MRPTTGDGWMIVQWMMLRSRITSPGLISATSKQGGYHCAELLGVEPGAEIWFSEAEARLAGLGVFDCPHWRIRASWSGGC
jgi:hypothetical protein